MSTTVGSVFGWFALSPAMSLVTSTTAAYVSFCKSLFEFKSCTLVSVMMKELY